MSKKHTLKNKLILIIAGIGLALLTVELCLSIFSYVLLKTHHTENKREKNQDQVKILCLGDS